MTIAITFEFEAAGDQDAGWSETYYSPAATTGLAYQVAAALSQVRCACMSYWVKLPYVTLTPQPVGSGIPFLINTMKDPNFANVGGLQVNSALQVVKGLLRLVATTGQKTQQPFGGIPSSLFGPNGSFTMGGAFKTTFNAYIAALVAQSICIRKVNNPVPVPPNQGGHFKQPILSISIAGVLSVPNNGFAVGAKVYVGRVKPGFGLRGFWKIATNDGNNITLQGWTPSPTQIPNTRSQYVQLYDYTYPAIAANPTNPTNLGTVSTIVRAGKHAVGRTKNPTTGRRKRPVK